MEKKFTIGEAVKFGWETFKKNYLLLIGVAAIDIVINSIPNMISKESSPGKNGIELIIWLVETIVQIGVITITLKLVDSKKASINDLFSNIRVYWRYLGGSILYFLIVSIGLILLIVPGVIWGIKYQFYGFNIVDKKMGVIDALKESAKITEGVRWDLFIFGLALVGIIILGALALGIGLFAAIPVVWLATAFIYRKLSKSTKEIKREVEVTPIIV